VHFRLVLARVRVPRILGRVRRTPAFVSLIIFADAVLFGVITPLVPGYVADYHLSTFAAGILVGAFGAGVLAGAIPTGILAGRFGAKTAVVLGLLLLAGSSFGFALAHSPTTIMVARFVQGFSSTTTWAGALAWLTVGAPRARRGQLLGTVFGFAVLGAILGPTFGAAAEAIGVRASFVVVGVIALVLTVVATLGPRVTAEHAAPQAFSRALRDRSFVLGLWLNAMPSFFFGALYLLAPLALSGQGYGSFAIAAVFLVTGVLEAALNPVLGRVADRRGTLFPIRISLTLSIATGVALAVSRSALVVVFVVLTSIAFSTLFTPGMALVSNRAEHNGLTQGFAFGVMNGAWALGQVAGAPLAGAVAGATGNAAAYLLCVVLAAVTLAAVITRRSL
jgi:MFS family permease